MTQSTKSTPPQSQNAITTIAFSYTSVHLCWDMVSVRPPLLVWNLLCSPGWPQTSSNSVFCHRRAEVIIEALCHYFWLDNTIFHNSHKHLAKFCTFQQLNLEPQQNSQVWPSGLSRNYLGVLILKTDLGHIPELIKHLSTRWRNLHF